MKAAILSIGTELTRGEQGDANSPWLAEQLTALGFEVTEVVCVDDDPERITASLLRLSAGASVVLATGGLGPLPDDHTAQAAASAAGVSLRSHEEVLEAHRRRRPVEGAVSLECAKLSQLPEGAEILGDPAAGALAFRLALGSADCYFLPGSPEEVERAFDERVRRRVVKSVVPRSYSLVLRAYGLDDETLASRVAELSAANPRLSVMIRHDDPEVEIRLLARCDDPGEARSLAERAADELRVRLGDAVFGDGDERYPAAVGRGLRARGLTLAVAETCTGGLIGAMLTSVPGASEFLLLDAVTYANAAKERVLGVPSEVLRAYGAVSPECARAMAEGALALTGADLALAVTGIAGPGGATADKPVGVVYLALADAVGVEVHTRRFAGDRQRVQRASSYAALALVRARCLGAVAAHESSVCG